MNQANSPSASFSLLLQATSAILVFQGVFLLMRVFSDGESSGGMSAVLGATLLQLGFARRLAADPQGPHTTFYILLWRYGALLTLGVISVVVAVDTYAPASIPNGLPTLIAMLLSMMIALKGAVLGKLKPNGLFGLRLRWTRQSRLAWEQAHRLLGRTLFSGGLIALVTSPFVPFPATLVGLAVLVFIGVTAATIKSRRVWQNDPERIIVG